MDWIKRVLERLFPPDDPLYVAAIDVVVDELSIEEPDAAQVVSWFESASKQAHTSGAQWLRFSRNDIPADEYLLVTKFLYRCSETSWIAVEEYVVNMLGGGLRVNATFETDGWVVIRVDPADSSVTTG